MTSIDIAVILIFTLLVFICGLSFSKSRKNIKSFFAAGGALPWWEHVGAFLGAGTEMFKYAKKNENQKNKNSSKFTTYMKDGGWCWYQDPRAIIKNGKLIIGGLRGQSGHVKVGGDLNSNTSDGTIVLDKNFQRNDHNVPAFYARPDGIILSVWAKHANEKIHYYSISSPTNYLEWGGKKKFD